VQVLKNAGSASTMVFIYLNIEGAWRQGLCPYRSHRWVFGCRNWGRRFMITRVCSVPRRQTRRFRDSP